MNDQFYTQDGERPDLAAMPVNLPEEYVGNRIFPVVPTMDKSGTIYYSTLTADSAAQTNRSAGSGPASTRISDSSTTFTAAEVCKRASISPDEAKQMGGIAKADEVGAKWAKRQVANYIEGLQRTALFTVAADQTFDPTAFRSQAQTALNSIRRYAGKTVLVGGTNTLKKMVDLLLSSDAVGPAFARIISGGTVDAASQGFSFAAWKAALAMWAGVDEVLAGADDIWGASTAAQKVAITKIDAGTDPLSHKWEPVLGKTFQFLPDGTQPYLVSSVADRVAIDNHYDAFAWVNVVTLNSGTIKVIDGIA